ncbi:42481_t:CDS:1, partial [Gigaspora margarita]
KNSSWTFKWTSKITKYIIPPKALTNKSNYTKTTLKTFQNSVGSLAFEKDIDDSYFLKKIS